jgi:hypothetical protein
VFEMLGARAASDPGARVEADTRARVYDTHTRVCRRMLPDPGDKSPVRTGGGFGWAGGRRVFYFRVDRAAIVTESAVAH